jgi:hypothetical protein
MGYYYTIVVIWLITRATLTVAVAVVVVVVVVVVAYLFDFVPLLKQCNFTRIEVRKHMHNLELLREMQDICSDFDDSAKRWNDHLQTLIEVRSNEIAKGLLTETSDRVNVPFSSVIL